MVTVVGELFKAGATPGGRAPASVFKMPEDMNSRQGAISLGLLEEQVVRKGAVTGLARKADGMARLKSVNILLNRGLAWLAAGSLLLMVFLVVGNALARVVYQPFTGTVEVVGWLTAVTIGFGLGYTQVHRGYVEIDALVERLPRGVQRAIRRGVLCVSMAFFALVAWQVAIYGCATLKNGNLSETLWLPYYPLIFLLALGFAGLTLAILVDLLEEFHGGAGK